MFEYHVNKPKYFNWQYRTSKDYIIPFISQHVPVDGKLKVLEIGCAEAGVLKAFTELGHTCTGIELSPSRAKLAEEFQPEEIADGRLEIISKNIYDINFEDNWNYDLIILKDVIEHIHNHATFIKKLKDLMAPNGKVFFGFPPWQMPFGGHQQVAESKILSKLPYSHLLPRCMYKGLLQLFGEKKVKVDNLLEVYDTRISLEKFERLVRQEGYTIVKRKLFLVNPIYSFKFGMKVREQFGFIAALPWIRNFFTTCGYYLIEQKQ